MGGQGSSGGYSRARGSEGGSGGTLQMYEAHSEAKTVATPWGTQTESYGEGWVLGSNGYHVYATRQNGTQMVDQGNLPRNVSIGDSVVEVNTYQVGTIIQANIYRSGSQDYNVQFPYDRNQKTPREVRVVAKAGQSVPKQNLRKGSPISSYRDVNGNSQYTVDGFDASFYGRVNQRTEGAVVRGAGIGIAGYDLEFVQPNGVFVRVPSSEAKRRVRKI